jgi:toxin ParE1/3/4
MALKGTRELVVTGLPFLIVYQLAPDEVHLLTIVHGAQQYPP